MKSLITLFVIAAASALLIEVNQAAAATGFLTSPTPTPTPTPTPAKQTQKQTVTCPVVASKASGLFQTLGGNGLVCYKNTSTARAAGNKSGKVFVLVGSSPMRLLNAFSMEGQGESNSPAFRISTSPGVISYNWPGSGRFQIDLVDLNTGRIVDRLVRINQPASDATFFINRQGVFFLDIIGSEEISSCSAFEEPETWSVDFHIMP